MSIKTSKRIALGVITALVFAPFAAVVPAQGASATVSTGTSISLSASTVFVQAGATATATATFAGTAVSAAACTVATAETRPNGSSIAGATAAAGSSLTAATLAAVTTAGDPIAPTLTGTSGAWSASSVLSHVTDVPGTYTVTMTMTTAACSTNAADPASGQPTATLTIIALPSTSTTTAITANQTASSGTASEDTTITVTRNTGGANTDGQILGLVTLSSDATDFPLNAYFGAVAGTISNPDVIVAGTAATPTFQVDRTSLAAGNYQVRFFVDTNSSGTYNAGEPTVLVDFSVAGTADALSISLSSATRANVSGLQSFTVTVTVSDDDANPSSGSILVTETVSTGSTTSVLNLTNVAADTALVRVGTSNTYVGTFAVDASPTGDYQDTYITAHIGSTVTATTDVKASAALRVVTLAELRATADGTSMSVSDVEGVGTVSATTGLRQDLEGTAATDIALTVDPAVQSLTFTGTAASTDAGEYIKVTVTPGGLTDDVAASTTLVPVLGDLSFTHTIAVVFEDEDTYTVTFTGTSLDVAAVITFADPAPRWATSPASFKAKYADKVSLTGTLSDQFGRPYASKAVTATVTGRNPSTSTLTTNASGQVTLEYTDASTSTTVLVDTMTFSYVYLATAAATASTTLTSTAKTATFSSTGVVVGSIVVTENSDNTEDIENAYVSGLPGTLVTYTATLKTATGAPVASGVVVTFSGGADDIFYGSKTGVTDAFGQATTTVHRQKAGYSAISATAGGVSSNTSGSVLWSNVAGNARHLAVSTAQTVTPGSAATIIATVTDRFGNPVNAVNVTFSVSGSGRLIAGDAGGTKATNINGQAQIQVTSLATETGVLTALVSATGAQFVDAAGFVGAVVAPGVKAGNTSATSTVTFAAAATPEVVAPSVAPSLTAERQGNRVFLFGSCMADEGDMIIYVKSPGKAWSEKAKTLECAAGEYDGDIRASKKTKFYRVKQEGTGLWSTSKLVRP